jgi:hypothetical protein
MTVSTTFAFFLAVLVLDCEDNIDQSIDQLEH